MVSRTAAALVAVVALVGCARNEYGIPLKKKPDLSAVQPGTPVNKVRGLKKPVKKEVLTKGDLKGAEAWLFEWDLPNDEVNNRMFTSVVVKDGVVLGWHEETANKWNKNSQLYKAARLDTALENLAAAQARLAYTQMAAGMIANYNATRPRYDPVQTASTMFANSYQPWKDSGTVNYGMVGGGPIAYGGPRPNATSPSYRTPGTASRVVGNQIYHGDGSASRIDGDRIVHRDGSYSRVQGNTIVTSPGNDTSRIYGNRIQHSDGTSSRVQGNVIYHD
jgi:hypothetical protein